jgi:hypothetical protein
VLDYGLPAFHGEITRRSVSRSNQPGFGGYASSTGAQGVGLSRNIADLVNSMTKLPTSSPPPATPQLWWLI